MITDKLSLIDEQSSPLFRIMWISNVDEPVRRNFHNNISAFHIGNGLILSVAHNLRTDAQIFQSIDEVDFQADIIGNVLPNLQQLFLNSYHLDLASNKRHLIAINEVTKQTIITELRRINFDTRWVTLAQKQIYKPFLIVQFRGSDFYNDPALTGLFGATRHFFEPTLQRYTFLIQVELVEAFYSDDIAMYRIVNTPAEIIARLPFINPDFSLFESNVENYYCLQSAPVDNLGRLLNEARIEGILDHWNVFHDLIGGNYMMDGTRYLIKGYFRFGSSGAPYIVFDNETNQYKVNAVQSEASPIQLAINNNRNGNFQYINAIASPIQNIRESIEQNI